jgi:hypothetical protein
MDASIVIYSCVRDDSGYFKGKSSKSTQLRTDIGIGTSCLSDSSGKRIGQVQKLIKMN